MTVAVPSTGAGSFQLGTYFMTTLSMCANLFKLIDNYHQVKSHVTRFTSLIMFVQLKLLHILLQLQHYEVVW